MLTRYRSGLSAAICDANLLREGLGLGPRQFASPGRQRRHHVQSLAAGGFAEADQPEIIQPIPHFLGGGHNVGKGDIRTRVQIEHESPRDFGMIRLSSSKGEVPTRRSARSRQVLLRGRSGDRACDRQTLLPVPKGWRCPASRGVWKNCSPAIPSGARTMEQGRPLR